MNEQSTHRPSEVLETLKRLGVRVAVTVPDSWLGEILVRIEREPEMSLIRATHEEEALAIALVPTLAQHLGFEFPQRRAFSVVVGDARDAARSDCRQCGDRGERGEPPHGAAGARWRPRALPS